MGNICVTLCARHDAEQPDWSEG